MNLRFNINNNIKLQFVMFMKKSIRTYTTRLVAHMPEKKTYDETTFLCRILLNNDFILKILKFLC